MSKLFEKKSIFVWNVPSIEGGDPAKIVRLLQDGGFEAVWIKAADGPYVFQPSFGAFPFWLRRPNVSPVLVDALHAAGIAVGGWGFCYGTDGDGEGRIAAQQVAALNLDGWGWNVEGQFEAFTDPSNPSVGISRAGKVVGTYKKTMTRQVPTALISWAQWKDPTPGLNRPWHNKPMAQFFMENTTLACDYAMPMAYWSRLGADRKPVPTVAEDAALLLRRSVAGWHEFTQKPIIPIGRAYTGDSGIVTPDSVIGFDSAARSMGLPGQSWWVLDSVKDMATIWGTLRMVNGRVDIPPVDPDPPVPMTFEERFQAIERDIVAIKKKLNMP